MEGELSWIRLIGFCLLAAVIVTTLRQMNPQYAGLLCAAFGVMLIAAVLPQIRSYAEMIRDFLEGVALDGETYRIMLRASGIVLVTQISTQLCKDMDAPSVGQRVELCGRLALLGIAVPVFIELTRLSLDVLR